MKTVQVFVTNKTPNQVTILSHVIHARAINQSVHVLNSKQFHSAIKASYPNGELVMSCHSEKQIDNALQTAPNKITELVLSTGLENSLIKAGIESVVQLTEMTAEEIVGVKGIADAGLNEIKLTMAVYGLTINEANDDN